MPALTYPMMFDQTEEYILVRSRDFPWLITHGSDDANAREMAADALITCIDHLVSRGEDIPAPSPMLDGEVPISPKWVQNKPIPTHEFEKGGVLNTGIFHNQGDSYFGVTGGTKMGETPEDPVFLKIIDAMKEGVDKPDQDPT